MATIETINPATGEPLERFETASQSQIDAVLDRARETFERWRLTTFSERSALMRRAAERLRAERDTLAALMVREMGKPIVQAEAEIEKCAVGCEHYADHAQAYLQDEPTASNATESYVAYRPLGVVLAVMPWNFPFWQVFRFAAPALMAGNVGVLKHSSNTTRCAIETERIFRDAGFPEGAFSTLVVPGSEASKLIEDRRIAAVTLTGSSEAGVSVAGTAGKQLKKSVLELGGSDAFIVLADADIDEAAKVAAKARFQNTGQSCIAAKRFIVLDEVYDAFLERFVRATEAMRVGDPMQRETEIGPLARADLRKDLQRQIDGSVAMGARLVTGGKSIAGKGAFFEPTIVADVTADMPMFREETFGPAAAVIRARNENDAIALANDSDFGLGGNLWTRDIERGKRIAERLESGGVFINGMTASDPRLPFGGVKTSGYGRELSYFGIREFMNVQTVWIGPVRTESSAQSPARATAGTVVE